MDYSKTALTQHKKLHGKLEVTLKDNLTSREQLSIYYTPGVGAVSSYIYEHPKKAKEYTWLNNSLAVLVTDQLSLG